MDGSRSKVKGETVRGESTPTNIPSFDKIVNPLTIFPSYTLFYKKFGREKWTSRRLWVYSEVQGPVGRDGTRKGVVFQRPPFTPNPVTDGKSEKASVETPDRVIEPITGSVDARRRTVRLRSPLPQGSPDPTYR